MSRIHGYRILNLVLSMKCQLVNLEVLDAVFMIVKASGGSPEISPNSMTPQSPRHRPSQLLVNTLALSYLLLDFTLWVHSICPQTASKLRLVVWCSHAAHELPPLSYSIASSKNRTREARFEVSVAGCLLQTSKRVTSICMCSEGRDLCHG